MILHNIHLRIFRLLAFAAVIFIFSFTTNIFPQTRVDSLEYIISYSLISDLNTRFEKQLNTFYLNSNFRLSQEFENIKFRINENFGSTFIRNESRNTRDEQHLNFHSKYVLTKDIGIGFAGNSSLLSDNRSLGGINLSLIHI